MDIERHMAAAVHAEAEEAHGAAPPATRDLLAISISARAIGGDPHQSDPAGLGELFCHWTLESLLSTRQTLGRAEDPTPSAPLPASSRVWVGGMEHLATVRRVWPVQRLSRASGSALGTPRPSGLITLAVNHTRERSAITPHAAFDVAGAGNVAGFIPCRRASPRPYRVNVRIVAAPAGLGP